MNRNWTRREILQSTSLGGALMTGWKGLTSIAVAANKSARSDAEIERFAEQIMDTPADEVVRLVLNEMKKGLSVDQLLAAEFNAGMRFRGHHSAYVAASVAAVAGRVTKPVTKVLPVFYYLNTLKFRARRNALHWVDKKRVPPATKAKDFFHVAMTAGERRDAGLALISLGRELGPKQAFRELWEYGAERNSASGGHTAISVVNTYRTLEATNWQCSETALQFAAVDEAWRLPRGSNLCLINRELSKRIDEFPQSWSTATADRGATLELLNLYRKGRPDDACETSFDMLLQDRVSAQSVWDAVFLTTAELVVRYEWVGQKMLAGHSVTCVNALHYMFRTASEPAAKLYSLLEAIEWATSFLARERARPALRDLDLLKVEPVEVSNAEAMEAIFSRLPPRRFASMARPGFENVDEAMKMTLGWATRNSDHRLFLETAMQLLCIKSTAEVHDFKFPMALIENYDHISAEWKPLLLAASVHVLHGTIMEDSPIVQQAREQLVGFRSQ